MKKPAVLLMTLAATALMAFLAGCATTHQTEELLTSAGFKAMQAATPEQQAHLKSLPHKLTKTTRDGKEYYVFPDAPHNVLYVGQEANFQRYQQLRKQQALAEEQITPADQMQINYGVWGAW